MLLWFENLPAVIGIFNMRPQETTEQPKPYSPFVAAFLAHIPLISAFFQFKEIVVGYNDQRKVEPQELLLKTIMNSTLDELDEDEVIPNIKIQWADAETIAQKLVSQFFFPLTVVRQFLALLTMPLAWISMTTTHFMKNAFEHILDKNNYDNFWSPKFLLDLTRSLLTLIFLTPFRLASETLLGVLNLSSGLIFEVGKGYWTNVPGDYDENEQLSFIEGLSQIPAWALLKMLKIVESLLDNQNLLENTPVLSNFYYNEANKNRWSSGFKMVAGVKSLLKELLFPSRTLQKSIIFIHTLLEAFRDNMDERNGNIREDLRRLSQQTPEGFLKASARVAKFAVKGFVFGLTYALSAVSNLLIGSAYLVHQFIFALFKVANDPFAAETRERKVGLLAAILNIPGHLILAPVNWLSAKISPVQAQTEFVFRSNTHDFNSETTTNRTTRLNHRLDAQFDNYGSHVPLGDRSDEATFDANHSTKPPYYNNIFTPIDPAANINWGTVSDAQQSSRPNSIPAPSADEELELNQKQSSRPSSRQS